MKIRYFAWVRERAGTSEEDVDLPEHVHTVADVMAFLAARDEGFAYAFGQPEVIRAAIDLEHVEHDTPVNGARELAFFPPMTGG